MEDRKHFRQRQINGYGLSMNGGYYDGNDCCDPAQPPFLQQYHQRQGPSDFHQASRYTLPRIQEAAGLDDSAYTAPYKDDSGGLGEKRLFPYQKNGSLDPHHLGNRRVFRTLSRTSSQLFPQLFQQPLQSPLAVWPSYAFCYDMKVSLHFVQLHLL